MDLEPGGLFTMTGSRERIDDRVDDCGGGADRAEFADAFSAERVVLAWCRLVEFVHETDPQVDARAWRNP